LFPQTEIHILQKDLTTLNASEEVHEYIKGNGIDLDVLVNNAGFATFGYMNEIALEREVNMIQLNIVAVYKMTRLFLDDMVKKDAGNILNISSVTAFQPNPLLSTYGATKSFVLNFSRGLNYELKDKGSKVRVTTVCPTPVRTGFQKVANMDDSKLFDSWMAVTAEEVAKDAYKAIFSNEDMRVPKSHFHWLNKIARRLPTGLAMKIAAKELKN